jgi:molecular chaperone HscB
VSHFDIFSLPARYDLDVAGLEQKYRELSLQLHPDRVAQGDARERRVALEQTTALNDAYKVLKDPVKRAFYLLKLSGVDLDREDAGAQKDIPLEFLEEIMDLREALSNARDKGDLATAQKMARDVEALRQKALAEAAEALRQLEGKSDSAIVTQASHALARVRYFTRFLEEVEAFEEEAL